MEGLSGVKEREVAVLQEVHFSHERFKAEKRRII
jgi:hypothetical protein